MDSELGAVVARVAQGDQPAFAELYERLAPAVFGVAKRVLRDAAQAEEVAQEVFVEVWKQAARFDPERGGVRTWAVTIAHRRAVDRVRSEQAHRSRQLRSAPTETRPGPTPEDVTIDSEERHRARTALGELSAVQRQVLELAYYDGLTQVQIADELGIALGTVKTRARDGLIRLRAVMEQAS